MRVSIRGRSGRACASPSFVFALFPLSLHLAAVGGAVFEFGLRVAPPVIAAPAALAALVLPRIGGGGANGEHQCGCAYCRPQRHFHRGFPLVRPWHKPRWAPRGSGKKPPTPHPS